MTPDGIVSMETEPVTTAEVATYAPIVAEFVDYLRWLADQDVSRQVRIGELWQLYYDRLRCGRGWAEACEDIGLPERTDWSS